MKNHYMFFKEQLFEDFDLSLYQREDITIPKTNIHIYKFEYCDNNCDDITKATKLDELSQRLTETYDDTFQTILSESSQYFCELLYPLIVSFETKLRYAIYISRSLYESGNVNKESFLLEIGKKEKRIEDTDFGEIYEAVFTDKEFQGKIKTINSEKLTKADLIKRIEETDEQTMWKQIVGNKYEYIEHHFLEIKKYRNDIMHNHLISYSQYQTGKIVLQQAIDDLERVILNKLIVNNSSYLNTVNILNIIGEIIFKTVQAVAIQAEKFATPERIEGMRRICEFLASTSESDRLTSESNLTDNDNNDCNNEESPQEIYNDNQ